MIKLKNCLDIGSYSADKYIPKLLDFLDLIKKYNGVYFDLNATDSVYTIDEVKEVKHPSKLRDRIDSVFNLAENYEPQKNLVGASSFRIGFSEGVNNTFSRADKTATVKLGGYGYSNAYLEAGQEYTFSFLYHGVNQPELVKGNYPILADAYLTRQGTEITESISYAKEGDKWRISVTFIAFDTKDNTVGFTKPDNGECNDIDFTVSQLQVEKGDKFTNYQETTVQGSWDGEPKAYLTSIGFYDSPVELYNNGINYANFSYQSSLSIGGFQHANATLFLVNGKTIDVKKNQKITFESVIEDNFNALSMFKGELTEDEITVVKNHYLGVML